MGIPLIPFKNDTIRGCTALKISVWVVVWSNTLSLLMKGSNKSGNSKDAGIRVRIGHTEWKTRWSGVFLIYFFRVYNCPYAFIVNWSGANIDGYFTVWHRIWVGNYPLKLSSASVSSGARQATWGNTNSLPLLQHVSAYLRLFQSTILSASPSIVIPFRTKLTPCLTAYKQRYT